MKFMRSLAATLAKVPWFLKIRTTIRGVRRKPATIAMLNLCAAIVNLFWWSLVLSMWIMYGVLWVMVGICWLCIYLPIRSIVKAIKKRHAEPAAY